jgi:ParB family transcriptional regulator, chromosome partitioning protein
MPEINMSGTKPPRRRLSDLAGEVVSEVNNEQANEPAVVNDLEEPRSAIGRLIDRRNESIEAENVRLAEENERLRSGETAVLLDPRRVRRSKFMDRDVRAFSLDDPVFAAFVDEIRETNGNADPGVVRPITGDPDHDYEAAAGQRRHAACLVAEKPFKAFIKSLTDRELLKEKRTENAHRLDPSPYELGLYWHNLLKDKTYTSIRDLEDGEKVPRSTIHRYLKFADLPQVMVSAFSDPRMILQDWVEPLLQAYAQSPDRVNQAAQELREKPPEKPVTIFNRLIGKVADSRVIGNRHGKVLAHSRLVNGCPGYVLKKDAPPELIQALEAFLRDWAQKHGEEVAL